MTEAGQPVIWRHQIAFMEGRLYNAARVLSATGGTVAKVIRRQ